MTETLRTLGRRNILSISGGKDSTAMWLLAAERGIKAQAVFADTGNEHPLTYEYIDYLEATLGKLRRVRANFGPEIAVRREHIRSEWPKKGVSPERVERALALMVATGNPFLDLCMLHGRFPGTKSRFCSQELKRDVIYSDVFIPMMDAGYHVINWQGIRWDESASRYGMPETEIMAPRMEAYRPLIHWSAADVFAMHKKHGIRPNPLYTQGMSRVGCMPCIHATKSDLVEIARRYPGEIDRIEEWERIVSEVSRRGSATFFMTETADGTAANGEGVRNAVDHARTARGGKIYNLASIEAPAACASQYGLCE